MQRYFVLHLNLAGINYLTDNDAHHIINVMRKKVGDEIILCHEELGSYQGMIESLAPKRVGVLIKAKIDEDNEMPLKVSLAHGLIRPAKMEEVLEKCTALGLKEYFPIKMIRSNNKFDLDAFVKKRIRFEKIIKEASEQSRRSKLLKLNDVLSLSQLIEQKDDYDLLLYAYENEAFHSNNFKRLLKAKINSVLILIGPEGGLAGEEVEQLNQAGFKPISLGKRILRTELAPLYLLSAISYERELSDD